MKKTYFYIAFAIFCLIACIMAVDIHEKLKHKQSENPNYLEQEHSMKAEFSASGSLYEYHDPDCPLCRERRKQEVINIVDSIIHDRIVIKINEEVNN